MKLRLDKRIYKNKSFRIYRFQPDNSGRELTKLLGLRILHIAMAFILIILSVFMLCTMVVKLATSYSNYNNSMVEECVENTGYDRSYCKYLAK